MLEKLKKNLKPGSKLLKQPKQGPVWAGPESDAPNGGVTFSLLSRFLVCRERFRCLVVEGLKPADTFNPRIEFGNMWHVCEETHARQQKVVNAGWESVLTRYAQQIAQRYPFQREQIDHWYRVCLALFPLYVEHWSKHPDVVERTPLLQEQVFDVPYTLPSGRMVRLRGKWDSVDYLPEHEEGGKRYPAGDWVAENKTKSGIDARKISRQLKFDLQTMLYVIALNQYKSDSFWRRSNKAWRKNPTVGVRYNVVRRSAHKTPESMLKKVHEDAANGRIGEWFARWKVEISAVDVETFKRECLNPVLENLCNWWQTVRPNGVWTQVEQDAAAANLHWRHPFGVYNVLDEGGSSDLDEYLTNGSEIGLQRTDNLFPELTQ